MKRFVILTCLLLSHEVKECVSVIKWTKKSGRAEPLIRLLVLELSMPMSVCLLAPPSILRLVSECIDLQ